MTFETDLEMWKTRAINCEADLPDRQPDPLEPRFVVDVRLDGDDDPALSAENVRRLLNRDLEVMLRAGAIRAFSLKVSP